jgi:hypothetical protein
MTDSLFTDRIENTASNSSVVACVSVAAETCLSSHCLATVVYSGSTISPVRCLVRISFIVPLNPKKVETPGLVRERSKQWNPRSRQFVPRWTFLPQSKCIAVLLICLVQVKDECMGLKFFWAVALCSLVGGCQRLRGMCDLHILPRRRKQYVTPKLCYSTTRCHNPKR